MSEPVTNAEVEDVLSSIRRLVSEDKRPMQPKQADPEPPENGRLVLTPSLRVADEPKVAPAVDEEIRKEPPELTDFMDVSDEVTFDEDDHHDGDPLDVDDEPEAVDLAEDYSNDPYNFDEDEDGRDATDDVEVLEDAPEREVDVDAEAEAEAEVDVPEAEAKLELPPQVFAYRDRMESEHINAAKADTAVEDDLTDEGDEPNPAVIEDSKASALSAKIEALETAIGQISDTWEPDGRGSDDYSGTDAGAMNWEEGVQRDATGAPLTLGAVMAKSPAEDVEAKAPETDAQANADEKTAVPQAAEPQKVEAAQTDDENPLDDGGDTQLLDEEALRDMVSEIVRAELQGALGERITRNVRKLVRREIHRALTAQDLE